MEVRNVSIPGSGYSLSGTLVISDDTLTNLPAVVFYHGMVSKSKPRYVERAKKLAQQGIAALCFDFRGCGESDGELGKLSLADWRQDALLAFDYLASQPFVDNNRMGISGKSFGGYMGALVSEKRNVASIVVQAPGLYDDAWFDKPMQWSDEFMKQRIAYRNSPNALNNRAIRAISKYKNPLLVIGSELDSICPKPTLEGFFHAAGSSNKKLVWIKGADHSLTNEKHNEEYTQLMADWFKETL